MNGLKKYPITKQKSKSEPMIFSKSYSESSSNQIISEERILSNSLYGTLGRTPTTVRFGKKFSSSLIQNSAYDGRPCHKNTNFLLVFLIF